MQSFKAFIITKHFRVRSKNLKDSNLNAYIFFYLSENTSLIFFRFRQKLSVLTKIIGACCSVVFLKLTALILLLTYY